MSQSEENIGRIFDMLKGKVAMETGGTRGIGCEIVKMSLDNGASVALCGPRQETVDQALPWT